MKPSSCRPPFLFAATLALALLAAARSEENTSTIRFSDPGKPGTVKVLFTHGNLRVQGADTTEIVVKSATRPATQAPRKDGLRVLTASSSFALTEKENTVTLDAAADGAIGGRGDFHLTVPRSASLVVQNSLGGDITCSGLEGDIEINSMNGEIRLDEVRAGVVVSTLNGEIRASVRELRDGKPLSFTSMNGEVVLRVPSDGKANVRFRTQNGAVLTDFDDAALVTRTENTPRLGYSTPTVSGQVLAAGARKAIRDAARIAAQAGREAAEAAREGIEAARAQAEAAHAQVEAARAQAEAARAQAEAAGRNAEKGVEAAPPAPAAPTAPFPSAAPKPAPAPIPIRPPMPPTVTGGKLVTGTLNGGGPEISVTTMNGDVTLRHLEKK